MYTARLAIFVISFFICGIATYKITLFNHKHPNPLGVRIITALILLSLGILIEIVINFHEIMLRINRYFEYYIYIITIFKKVFLLIATMYHYTIASILFIATTGTFSKKVRFPLLFSFTVLLIADLLFRNYAITHYGFTMSSNLIIRVIVYTITGVFLIKAVRLTYSKPILQFTAFIFIFDTISLTVWDILKIAPGYSAIEYLLFFPIIFVYTIPFLRSLYPDIQNNDYVYKKLATDSQLTSREIEIVKMICVGKLNKEIADTLCLAENTIKSHIFNIYKKVNVKNRVELVQYLDGLR